MDLQSHIAMWRTQCSREGRGPLVQLLFYGSSGWKCFSAHRVEGPAFVSPPSSFLPAKHEHVGMLANDDDACICLATNPFVGVPQVEASNISSVHVWISPRWNIRSLRITPLAKPNVLRSCLETLVLRNFLPLHPSNPSSSFLSKMCYDSTLVIAVHQGSGIRCWSARSERFAGDGAH